MRPASHFNPEEYGPCPQYLGTYLKNDLWSHCTYHCLIKENEGASKSCRFESELISGKLDNVHDELKEIFAKMRNDDVKRIAKHDNLIQKLGLKWKKKTVERKNDPIRRHMISQK